MTIIFLEKCVHCRWLVQEQLRRRTERLAVLCLHSTSASCGLRVRYKEYFNSAINLTQNQLIVRIKLLAMRV